MKDVPASNKGLEARLKKAEEDLNAVHQERMLVKAMMQDIFRQERGSVEAVGLGSVTVGSQGLDTLGHLALGFLQIAQRLEALPAAVQELATRERRALAQGVAEHVLVYYHSRDPTFPLQLAQQGVVEAEEAAARVAVRDVATEVVEFFVREPGPGSDSSKDACPPP